MAAIGGIVSLVPFRWPLPAAGDNRARVCVSVAGQTVPFSTTSPQQQVWHDPGHATLALLAQNQNPYTAATAYVVRPIISSAIHGAGNAVRGAVNRVSNALGAASAASAMAAPYGYYLGEQAASASAYPLVPAVYSGIPDGSAQRFPQQGTGNEYYLHGMGHSYGASAPPPYGHGGYTNPYPVYTAPSLLTEVANHAAGGVASVAGLATNAVRSVTGMASQATQMATQGIATGLQTRPQIPWNEALSIAEKFVVPSIEAIAKAAPSIAARSPGEGPEEQGLKRLRRGDKGQETSPPDPNAPPPGSVPEKRPRLYVSQVGNAAVVN
ncbi:conserved hypothetical protein [Neospora caninum Liverpool]|uniref:Uncharacterized protein n=1 Tax=Neospora caninum (strain Liverpool) TaxID=572307 RepID=F0VFW0_NEOCL|nr:conserved hypothetical protein [Neospora caninum Liverpool]CBZ52604.1 conserved hypothetical protein [Neospora caninum Liverpool]CEL66582.1 TPA: hypothetical protein BN1204_023930 [Neospora caninum Liverpool]|eukprot:XP_003882636.1 conserved hypothetical protein [Neospora caninum Liverpool]